MINVEHLTKRFGVKCAVDDVTFSVSKGEVLGTGSWRANDVHVDHANSLDGTDDLLFVAEFARIQMACANAQI